MQDIKKEIMHQECLDFEHSLFFPLEFIEPQKRSVLLTLSSCFHQLANGVMFPGEFWVFVLQEEIHVVLLVLEHKKQGKT